MDSAKREAVSLLGSRVSPWAEEERIVDAQNSPLRPEASFLRRTLVLVTLAKPHHHNRNKQQPASESSPTPKDASNAG